MPECFLKDPSGENRRVYRKMSKIMESEKDREKVDEKCITSLLE